ncbi:MAG: YigZ family protein [Oscillospiraceae bacterium]|nr:YigZ family protein [Oscillospiraceae bacterium]
MAGGSYCTVAAAAEDSFIEKKSEFIGYIAPVSMDEEAVAFINSIKARHRKAKHNVYAYALRQGNITRYSDDGEPQGTAGVPVLEVLRKEGLTDVCCVVTRYFGGILLGGGGLVRTYSHAAKLAVDAAERMNMCPCRRLEVTANYSYYSVIERTASKFGVKTADTIFADNVTLALLCKSENTDAFKAELIDITGGSAVIAVSEEIYENFA